MSTHVTNSIPATLNDLLVKLKILSMVERGKKINTGNMTFTDANSWIGSFTRSLSGEGHKGLLIYLNQLIQQSINAINEYQDTEFCKLIVNQLAQAKIGILSFATTYQRYPDVVAQIEVCVSNIDLQLEKNRHLLDGHQKQISNENPILPTITQPAFGSNGIQKNTNL